MKLQTGFAGLTSTEMLNRPGGYDDGDEKLVIDDLVILALEVVATLAVCGAANWAATYL